MARRMPYSMVEQVRFQALPDEIAIMKSSTKNRAEKISGSIQKKVGEEEMVLGK
jgi:hypothetical protein